MTRAPDLASDAVQEAFATALERIDTFRGESRATTWLHRIVYTKAIDLLRKRGRERQLDVDEPELGPDDDGLAKAPAWARPPDELLLGTETRQALERALEDLTPVQRAIFELREVEGRATDEVAEILDLPPGTVRVYLHRARLRLRALLGPYFRGEAA